jgi:hypothetical protein
MTFFWKDGVVQRRYINGVQIDSINNVDRWPEAFKNVTIGLGFSESGERWFKGSVDDVRIYNKAVSVEEVQQLFSE